MRTSIIASCFLAVMLHTAKAESFTFHLIPGVEAPPFELRLWNDDLRIEVDDAGSYSGIVEAYLEITAFTIEQPELGHSLLPRIPILSQNGEVVGYYDYMEHGRYRTEEPANFMLALEGWTGPDEFLLACAGPVDDTGNEGDPITLNLQTDQPVGKNTVTSLTIDKMALCTECHSYRAIYTNYSPGGVEGTEMWAVYNALVFDQECFITFETDWVPVPTTILLLGSAVLGAA